MNLPQRKENLWRRNIVKLKIYSKNKKFTLKGGVTDAPDLFI